MIVRQRELEQTELWPEQKGFKRPSGVDEGSHTLYISMKTKRTQGPSGRRHTSDLKQNKAGSYKTRPHYGAAYIKCIGY